MGKGTIDGEKFIMNNQEVEIPNFGGGKDSAVIPLYARGFVPNYANRSYTQKQIDKFKPKKDQIDNFRLSKVEQTINDPRFKSFDDDTKAALRAKQQQLKPSKLLIPKALTDQIPFLIPLEGNLGDLGKLRSGTASVLGNDYPYELETGEGQIDYYFPNITPENVDLSDNPYDAQLEDKITENIIDSATAFAKILKPPSKVQGIREKIKDRLTGQSGAAGAIVSAVGAAFEASISAALNIKQAKSRNDADFDVPDSFVEGKETLTRLFGMKEGWKAAEFKATGSRGNINSYIGKIIKFNQLDSKPKKEKKTTTTPKKASGFIPNFAAVNDAISREMEAGVPRDKIYVDQNSSLKSSLNPEGIMVANTIDEPNGGIQGIRRAKKEGQNPKTYGQNFAARGFVPNYALGLGSALSPAGNLPAAAAQTAATASLTSATNSATQAVGNLGKAGKSVKPPLDDAGKSLSGLVGAAFGFSVVINTALPYLQQFVAAIALDEEALKREVDARNKASKALAEEKAKGALANAESIKSIETEIASREESIVEIEQEALKFGESLASATGGITNLIVSLSILGPAIKGAYTAFKTAQVASAAAVAAGGSGGAVALLSRLGLPGLIAAAIAGAMVVGFNMLEKSKQERLKTRAFENKASAMQLDVGRLSTDIAKIQLVIDALAQASRVGYQTIKLSAEGMRSEFQRLNDEIGVSGASSKITQAEGLDKIISGGKDFITQQNLKKTRDPFEQQRIVENRQAEKAGPEADRDLQRSRAKAALEMKGAQEDLYTALKPYLNEGMATSATTNAAINPNQFKSVPDAPKPPTAPSVTAVMPYSPAWALSQDEDLTRITRSNEYDASGLKSTEQGKAGILPKDLRESENFAKTVQAALSKSSKESQSELLKAFNAYDAASKNLKNTTAGVDGSGNIVSNQERNMKQFSDTRDALKALVQERAKSSGGDVEAVTQAFDDSSDKFEAGVKAQTDAFIKDQQTKKQIELDSLQQQKEVLDQFIDNFNASFLQNAERGADLFAEAMASGSGTRIQENIAQLQGASLGTGMAGSSDVFAQRQEALIQMMSSLESSGFFQSVGTGEEQAKFRSQFAGQVLGGGEITALQGALGAQSANLQKQLSATNSDGTENVLGKQINSDPNARTAIADSTLAFKEILTKLREAAVAAGDTNLTADVDKRLATLSDPNATAQQKIAAGNIGLEGTKLEDATQTEFQKQLISAGGAIQSVVDLLKGESVSNATNDLGIKIEENVKSLEILRDAFKTTAEDIKLATIVDSVARSTDGFKEVIDTLKESATGFKTELNSLKEGIEALKTDFGKLTKPTQDMKTDLDNLAIAAKAAEVALKAITPPAGDSGGGSETDAEPK
jgi:hypothetical protein